MSLISPVLALLLALPGGFASPAPVGPGVPAPADEGPVRMWETLVLPAGFCLDLQSGVVVSRPGPNRPVVRYSRGRLSSDKPLRLLPMAGAEPMSQFDRDGGDAVNGVTATVGQNLIFDLYGEAWGLVRVLEVSPEAIGLELVYEPDPALRELSRAPAALQSRSGPDGVHLAWPAQQGELYRVERRRLAKGTSERHGPWNEVAQVGGDHWTDEEVLLSRISEYRVSLLGDGGGFGSSAFGVPGMESSEVRAELGPGSEFNLLCALEDGERADVTIETIRSNGVQVSPGEGVLARMLTLEEESRWSLDEIIPGGYHNQHFFVPPGRVLALRTAEGVHCLFRVESIRDGYVGVTRQLDLQGDRLFPPAPAVPQAEWQGGRGVVFQFPKERALPPHGAPILVAEREQGLDSGDWEICAIGLPGDLEIVDREQSDSLLVRYRFRQGLDLERLSAGSEPVTVLVGGEDDVARNELLQQAIQDLGAKDYSVREEARGVLLALGEGAWPLLREALRSGNAELAINARELLVQGLREAEGDEKNLRGGLARLLLSIRAEELGLAGAPSTTWTDRVSGVRALASLRGDGWRANTAELVSAWRRVLEQADPDEGVQLAAGLAALLESEGFGPDLSLDQEPTDWHGASFEGARRDYVPGVLGREEGSSPWNALVGEQARCGVERASWNSNEEVEMAEERWVLARSLSSHFARTGDDLFLDAALRVIDDPVSRFQGARSFANERRAQRRVESAEEWRTVRLSSPDSELLRAELELLHEGAGGPVEIILPAGVYDALPNNGTLSAVGAQFRLRGEGEVEIRAAMTLLKGCQATFENLSIVPEVGTAINLAHSDLLLRDCEVRGGNLGVLGTDCILELEGTAVIGDAGGNPGSAGVRCGGRSLLLAQGSRIECPGVAVSGFRAALIDRCVISSTDRNGIEGGSDADLWMMASLLRSKRAPYQRVARGVFEGVAIQGTLGTANGGAPGVQACYEHIRVDGPKREFSRDLWLDGCCLRR